ncbi:putative 2EXR domain-containing protein [Seiridium cardinale]|uniref:2EXR domain-containing protein n=1 Tax=Seiridium cardinale TaxID=138064 RepID=A0ABR2XT25_9PEZI
MTPDETGTGQYSGSKRDDKRQIKALSSIQQSIEALSQKVEAIARDQTLQRAVNADILERLATMEHNAGQRYSDLDEKADSCLEELSELNRHFKCAIPARLLEINEISEDMAPGIAEYAFMVPLAPPAIAGVCREARAVACQTGRLVCIDNRIMVWVPAHAPRMPV